MAAWHGHCPLKKIQYRILLNYREIGAAPGGGPWIFEACVYVVAPRGRPVDMWRHHIYQGVNTIVITLLWGIEKPGPLRRRWFFCIHKVGNHEYICCELVLNNLFISSSGLSPSTDIQICSTLLLRSGFDSNLLFTRQERLALSHMVFWQHNFCRICRFMKLHVNMFCDCLFVLIF